MSIGDVITINGTRVTVEHITETVVSLVWFEGETLHRGSVSPAIAAAGR